MPQHTFRDPVIANPVMQDALDSSGGYGSNDAVETIVPGDNISVDATDPNNPVVSADIPPPVRDSGVAAADAAGIPLAGMRAWLDAADRASITLDGGQVAELRDRSGNGLDFVAGGGGPTVQSAHLNGLDTLGYDGGRFLLYPGPKADTNFLHQGPSTVFAMVRAQHTGGIGPVLSDKNESSAADHGYIAAAWFAYFGEPVIIIDSGDTDDVIVIQDSGAPDDTWTLLAFAANPAAATGSRAFIYRNGTSVGSTNTHTGTAANVDSDYALRLGGDSYSNLVGSIAEVIIYDRLLSAAERRQVEAYLRQKWLGNTDRGPLLVDQSDGHTYRLIVTNGTLSAQLVV